VLLGAFALGAAPCAAQWSGNVSIVSDYRYRGISLSDDGPALQGSATYDDASGLYAGAFASTVRYPGRPTSVQAIPYLGYAHRLASGWSLDVGADASVAGNAHDYDYQEAYAGLAFEGWTGRIVWSPHYYGQPAHVFYGEIDGSVPLTDITRLIAHAGALGRGRPNAYVEAPPTLYDAKLGVAADVAGFTLQLAYVWSGPSNAYPLYTSGRRETLVFTLSRAF